MKTKMPEGPKGKSTNPPATIPGAAPKINAATSSAPNDAKISMTKAGRGTHVNGDFATNK